MLICRKQCATVELGVKLCFKLFNYFQIQNGILSLETLKRDAMLNVHRNIEKCAWDEYTIYDGQRMHKYILAPGFCFSRFKCQNTLKFDVDVTT